MSLHRMLMARAAEAKPLRANANIVHEYLGV